MTAMNFQSNIVIGGALSASLKSAFGNLRGEYDKVSSELTGLKSKQKDLNKEITSAKRAGQSIEKLQDNYQKLEQNIKDTTSEQKELHQHIQRNEQAGRPVVRLQNRYDRLGREITDAKLKQQSLTTSIAQARTSAATINSLENEYKQLGNQIDRASQKQRQFSSISAKRKDRKMARDDARGDLFDKVVLGAVFAQPIGSAIKFESVMADLNKVASLTSVEYKETQKSILNMASATGMASDQIGAIMTSASQANIAKNELNAFTDTAIKMGVAFDISGSKSGDMMSGWRAGMKLTQGQVITLADTINELSNKSGATAPDIAAVVTRMGAVAKTAGLAETEIAGLSAALLNAKAPPEIAGTALKNFTNSLTKGEAATKRQREAYASLGLDQEQLAKDMQINATETMKRVLKALSGADDYRKSGLISDLFGEEAKGAIAPLLTNLDKFNEIMDVAADKQANAGSMLKEYQVRSKTTAVQVARFTQTINNLGITIGSVLLPPINRVLGGLTKVISFVSNIAGEFPTVTKYVTLFGTAFIGLSIAISAVKWASLALMAANPLGMILALGAGAVMVATAIYDNWSSLSGFFDQSLTVIGNIFKALGAVVLTAFGVIFAISPIGWIVGIVKSFDIIFKQWDSALSFSENFGNGLTAVFASLQTSIGGAIQKITGWISPFIDNVKSALNWLGILDGKSNTVRTRDPKNKRGGGATQSQNDNTVRTRNSRRFRDGRSGTQSSYTDNSKQEIKIEVHAAAGQSEAQVAQNVVNRLPRRRNRPAAKLYDGVD